MLTADHPALLGFHAALDANQRDWTTRLIMADWHEDQGEELTAAAIRWQVKRRKRPEYGYLWEDNKKRWCRSWLWYDEAEALWDEPLPGKIRRERMDPPSDIPQRLWRCLEGGDEIGRRKSYRSRREAEEALWRAWICWKTPKKKGRPGRTQPAPASQVTSPPA